MNKSRFSTLDVLKALFAFFVIILHSPDFMGKEFLYPATRMAVPFFFMVSGYFCYNSSADKLSKRIKKIFQLLVVSELLFAVWAVFCNRNSLSEFLNGILNVKFVLRFLILNEQPFNTHLWYLQAYLYVLIILRIFNCFKAEYTKKYMVLGIAILMYCLIMAEFLHNANNFNPYIYRNWLLGLAFVLIGMSIHHYKPLIVKLGKVYGIVALAAIAVGYFEAFYLNNFKQELYIGIVFAVVATFCLGISYPELLKGSVVEKIGLKYSLYIYIIHPIICHIINMVCMKLNISAFANYAIPIIVYVLSIFVTYFYIRIKDCFFRRLSVK